MNRVASISLFASTFGLQCFAFTPCKGLTTDRTSRLRYLPDDVLNDSVRVVKDDAEINFSLEDTVKNRLDEVEEMIHEASARFDASDQGEILASKLLIQRAPIALDLRSENINLRTEDDHVFYLPPQVPSSPWALNKTEEWSYELDFLPKHFHSFLLPRKASNLEVLPSRCHVDYSVEDHSCEDIVESEYLAFAILRQNAALSRVMKGKSIYKTKPHVDRTTPKPFRATLGEIEEYCDNHSHPIDTRFMYTGSVGIVVRT